MESNLFSRCAILLVAAGSMFAEGSAAAQTEPDEKPQQTATLNGVKLELIKCSLSGKNIQCLLNATSLQKDRSLTQKLNRGAVKVYTDNGDEIKCETAAIASAQPSWMFSRLFVEGVKTPIRFECAGVASTAQAISLLIYTLAVDGVDATMKLRNIPFVD